MIVETISNFSFGCVCFPLLLCPLVATLILFFCRSNVKILEGVSYLVCSFVPFYCCWREKKSKFDQILEKMRFVILLFDLLWFNFFNTIILLFYHNLVKHQKVKTVSMLRKTDAGFMWVVWVLHMDLVSVSLRIETILTFWGFTF